jgi:dipeptidyl aminopeptidase/acylaminoacyl peptidase
MNRIAKNKKLAETALPGTWLSPLTPEKMVQKTNTTIGTIILKNRLFILESRPEEKGRITLIDAEKNTELIPKSFNIRSKVHEYGGNCITTDGKNRFFFTEFSDQNIYSLIPGQKPEPVTHEKNLRFADFCFDQHRNCLFAVMEDHRKSDLTPVNSIVRISLKDGTIETVCEGQDFYAYPRLDFESKALAFIAWNHPQMPWDGTKLFISNLTRNGKVISVQKVAGGKEESVLQPEWHQDKLLYVSDKSGYYNLYSFSNNSHDCLLPLEADFAKPMWSIGACSYKPINNEKIFVTFCQKANWKCGIFNLNNRRLEEISSEFNFFSSISVSKQKVFFIAASYKSSPSAVCFSPEIGTFKEIYKSSELPIDEKYISVPESFSFEVEFNQTAQAFFYPPLNPDFSLPVNQKPPLIVISHGGPTGAANSFLDLAVQFWTTRGFAVVDVNYSGSAGFGRHFRDSLKGNWGINDVRDCREAAKYLIKKGLVDAEKIAIRGGSAGGYTTLCALTFTDIFKAGASYFGLSDLEMLAKETHKFESRYMDLLVGKYPQQANIYKERSPINHADKMSCPVIFFQGLDDKVVPPNQAERMFKILCKKNIPTAYVTYPGEGHGFRQSKNIKHSLESELYFYCKVLGFPVNTDKKAPIEIKNLNLL